MSRSPAVPSQPLPTSYTSININSMLLAILVSVVVLILLAAWAMDRWTRKGGHDPANGSEVASEVRRLHGEARAARAEMGLTPRFERRSQSRE